MARRKNNFYAVKVGKKPGIYDSWAKCKMQIDGVSGCQYKGFRTKKEAEAYLNGTDTESNCNAEITIYVDGSYDEPNGVYGYGLVVLLPSGEIQKLYGAGNNPEPAALRNVAGEMLAAMHAVRYAIKNGFHSVEICYDYSGIEMWATGGWKTKTSLTYKYADAMKKWMKEVDVSFRKVAAHTNVEHNELADQLAKYAVQEYIKKINGGVAND